MADSILGLDAKKIFGEEYRQEKPDIRILDNKILIISNMAIVELFKKGWYWTPKPSHDEICRMVADIKKGKVRFLRDALAGREYPISEKSIIEGLEAAMNGTWWRVNGDFTTPEHLKKCFMSFLNNDNFDEGKAELLMSIIRYGRLDNIRNITDNAITEVEREREEQQKRKQKTIDETNKYNRGFFVFIKRKICSLYYWCINEWDPKFIGGRLVVTTRGIIAYSTLDDEKKIVYRGSVGSAEWEGSAIRIYDKYFFGTWKMYGPR